MPADGNLPERVYTVFCPFGGIGFGALGFLGAETRLFGVRARFKCLGSLDLDALACKGFRYLTGAPAWECDIATLTPVQLLAWVGEEAPDVVFMSPPCKSFSKLTNKKARLSEKYKVMSRLVLDWTRTMLAAWSKRPPRLVLLENVPGIATLGKALLAEVREHVGNAVPVGAARAIAEQMLQTLVGSDLEQWALGGGGGAVWVEGPSREAVLQ